MIIPQVFEKTPQGERAFDIFSRLLRDRIVLLSSYIEDTVSNLTVAQLLFLEAEDQDKDIYLYINSPGGLVTSALAIYDTMKFVKPDISTICTGMAGASAALLMAAGAKGKRMCLPNARFMLHQVYGQAEGPAIDVQIDARVARDFGGANVVKHLRDHALDLDDPAFPAAFAGSTSIPQTGSLFIISPF